MALFMPPAIVEPVVVETFGNLEIFAHGAVCRDGGETIEVIFWRRQGSDAVEIARVFMPRSGFEASLYLAVGKWMGPAVH